jgi:magnesium transporter
MIRKEALVGATNGIAVGLVTALGVFLWSKSFVLAGVISVAMVLSMTTAAVCGSIIPIVLTTLGRDPATASSILLSAVTDTMGFLSFLGLATLMLHALVP